MLYKTTPSFINKMRYYATRFNNGADSICDVYNRPSVYKVNAYKYLCNLAIEGDCRILGHNCMQFTTGMYTYNTEAEKWVFRVDTRDNTYEIPAEYVQDITHDSFPAGPDENVWFEDGKIHTDY